MTTYPRAMADILREMVLWQQDTWWLKNKYLRRGRLVEQAASLLALGKGIEDEWWSRASGIPDRPDDYLPHEECRPAVNGAVKFLRERGFVLYEHGLEVTNSVERYIGHLDWLGTFPEATDDFYVIDLKHGRPPAKGALRDAYHYQTALYKLALSMQHGIIAKRAGLHLFDDTYELVKHDDPRDMTQALIAVKGWHLRNQYRGE